MRIVVKVGGAQLEEEGARSELALALRRAREAGHELVVVHGGGNQIRRWSARLGLAERYDEGLRVTDAATAELVLCVLGGEVNRRLCASLSRAGVPAVGLTGADAGLFSARRHAPEGRDLGYVGKVRRVDPRAALVLLAGGLVPVIATIAPLDAEEPGDDAQLYNINADQAAAPLAQALEADALLFLSDVPGVRGAEGEPCAELDAQGCAALRAAGALSGGMLPKLEAALEAAAALPGGLVKIASAAGADAVLAALEDGRGTRLRASEPSHHG